jgi:hypothetical protein
MTEKTARIVWKSQSEGGRQTPPSGPQYVTVARFDTDHGDVDSWSLVVDQLSRSSDAMEWIATVRFLVPEAPSELLRDGATFGLMEGKKRVAIGTIGSAVAPVSQPTNVPAAHEVGR